MFTNQKMIRKAFDYALSDSGGSGFDKTCFKVAWLYLFGYKLSKYELEEYFAKLGKNYRTGSLDYEDFERKASAEAKRLDSVEEMRNAFITVDFACKGFLTVDDLHKQFSLVAPKMSKQTVNDIFRYLLCFFFIHNSCHLSLWPHPSNESLVIYVTYNQKLVT